MVKLEIHMCGSHPKTKLTSVYIIMICFSSKVIYIWDWTFIHCLPYRSMHLQIFDVTPWICLRAVFVLIPWEKNQIESIKLLLCYETLFNKFCVDVSWKRSNSLYLTFMDLARQASFKITIRFLTHLMNNILVA